MSRRSLAFAIALLLITLLGILYYLYSKKNEFDWREGWIWPNESTYRENNDQPYGLKVLFTLLQNRFPEKLTVLNKPIHNSLPIDSTGKSTYVFFGSTLFHDSLQVQHLDSFVQAGNTAMISANMLPDVVLQCFTDACRFDSTENFDALESFYDSSFSTALTLLQPAAKASVNYVVRNENHVYTFYHIREKLLCGTAPWQLLGEIVPYGKNAIAVQRGKGKIFFHSTPLAFTNYHLLRTDMQQYAAAWLSYLPPGNTLYWDAASRYPPTSQSSDWPRHNRRMADQNLLQFVLQQSGLAWAWYLLVALALLYVIFAGKRRQRIVPVLPKNENLTHAFIHTIANLYFRQQNYRALCWQDMRLFLAYVRERYNLQAVLDNQNGKIKADPDYMERLAVHSEVPKENIEQIFQLYQNSLRYQATEAMMTDLHLAIERFMLTAK